ncbi:MAG: IclR family transcriptional regulator [Pseudolabrys sp.]|nr:IclR family transcriptional regulator [Pseudolabrys sp.]
MDTTLIKGLHVLETLVTGRDAMALAEVAAAAGLIKSNAHRALKTLIHCGYARQDSDGRYRATLKMWKLGSRISEQMDIRGIARPHLRKLSERTGETVHLSVLENGEVTYLEKIDSPHPVAAYSRLGGGGPAHCSATGKALLAFANNETRQRIAASLRRFTARTIVEPARLERELQTIRKNGFATTRGEWHEAVSGIAAPILAQEHLAVAAVGVSGLSARVTPTKLREFAPHVVNAAQAIAGDLG